MLDPSDYELTDGAEKEDSVDEEELLKDWEKRKEESDRRKVEKQNNNLAKYFQTVVEEKKYESSQHVPHIPMNKKGKPLKLLFWKTRTKPFQTSSWMRSLRKLFASVRA